MNKYLKNLESLGNPGGIKILTTTTDSSVVATSDITKDSQEGNTYLEPRRAKVRRYLIKK